MFRVGRSGQFFHNIGTLIITYTLLGFPYYNVCFMGPKNLFLIVKALF